MLAWSARLAADVVSQAIVRAVRGGRNITWHSGGARFAMNDFELLRNVTIGQYIPTGSIVHRLDPRAKLLATLFLMVAISFNTSIHRQSAFFVSRVDDYKIISD